MATLAALARTPLRAVLLALGVLVLIASRTAHLGLPVAALLAPAVCTVCRGCPVDHDHEVCDCESCQAEASGEGSTFKNPPHGGPSGLSCADEARFVLPARLDLLRHELLLATLSSQPPPLRSRPPPAPSTPPPRA